MKPMKRLMIAALLGGQLVAAAPPAFAADLTDDRIQQMGAFAGFRLRVPLDGQARQVRAGLTLAPTMYERRTTGESRMRMGAGIELGMVGGEPLRLSVAGAPVSRLAQGREGPDGRRLGISTLGWVAISVGVIVVTVLAVGQLCADGEICGSE